MAAEAVADEARAAGHVRALVVALRAAGWAARELYDHDAARRHLDEAVRAARAAGLDDLLAAALTTRSAVHLELGRDGAARRDLAAARDAARETARGEVAFAEGLREDQVGDHPAALRAYRRALDLVGEDRPHLRVKILNNLGVIAMRLGRHREAEQRLAAAEALAATLGPAVTALVTQSSALVAVEAGRPVEALRRYGRAEQLLRAADLPLMELHLDRAAALLSLQLLDEAGDAADLAVEGYRRHDGGSLMLAEALVLRARIALAQDRPGPALAAAGQAEDLFRRQRRAGWRAVAVLLALRARAARGDLPGPLLTPLGRVTRTLVHLGDVPAAVEAGLLLGELAAAAGRARTADAALADAAARAARGPALLRLQGHRAAALRAGLAGDDRRLARRCRAGLDELAAYRAAFASAELRARATGHGRALADLGLRAALRSARPERIWTWLEQAGATIFLTPAAGAATPEIASLLGGLRGLEQDLAALAPHEHDARAALLRRVADQERAVRAATWAQDGGAAWSAPSVATLRALRRDLHAAALLQYGVLDGRVVGVAVTPGRLRWADLGPVGPVLAAAGHLVFALRRLARPRAGVRAGATAAALAGARADLRTLAGALVGPLAGSLDAAEEVVVAAPSSLLGLPWGALPGLAARPVRAAPSATSWWRTRDRAPSSDRVVLVAGPGLEAADDEVAAAARHHPGAARLTGDGASPGAVAAAAAGARLVHLACHGALRADSPSFSALRLAGGPLTVHDLERLAPPAHHWVLASCDLGSPGPLAGGELEGVLAALLFGGAGGVVAATVAVPDVSTGALMAALHAALGEGASLATALWRARAAGGDDPAAFAAATAFSVYGGG